MAAQETLKEKIISMRCRMLIKAMLYIIEGYTISEAVEIVEQQADDEEIEKYMKAGGVL